MTAVGIGQTFRHRGQVVKVSSFPQKEGGRAYSVMVDGILAGSIIYRGDREDDWYVAGQSQVSYPHAKWAARAIADRMKGL